jgi:exodeoxyribonuclease VII small subunit
MDKVVQAKRDDASSPAFEDILSRLSTVVERLESGEMPLEESLALFEEGVHLSRLGALRLDDAEQRVERLLREDGSTRTIAEFSESSRDDRDDKESQVP